MFLRPVETNRGYRNNLGQTQDCYFFLFVGILQQNGLKLNPKIKPTSPDVTSVTGTRESKKIFHVDTHPRVSSCLTRFRHASDTTSGVSLSCHRRAVPVVVWQTCGRGWEKEGRRERENGMGELDGKSSCVRASTMHRHTSSTPETTSSTHE